VNNILSIYGSGYFKELETKELETNPRENFAGKGRYVLVADLAIGGEIHHAQLTTSRYPQLREHQVAAVMHQYMLGIRVMHRNRWAHRDIKAQNGLLMRAFDEDAFNKCVALKAGRLDGDKFVNIVNCLDPGSVKVMDFGLTCLQQCDTLPERARSSLAWLAPQGGGALSVSTPTAELLQAC
jgi:serine/threonine protein kinase